MTARDQSKYSKMIDDVGQCELCGSKRGLEVHHIIPMCTDIDGVDLNDDENLIVVCRKCHAFLTPRKVLQKYGIAKQKIVNAQLKNKYNAEVAEWKKRMEYSEKNLLFYSTIGTMLESGDNVDFCDLLDLHDQIYGGDI